MQSAQDKQIMAFDLGEGSRVRAMRECALALLHAHSFRYERELIIGEGNWLCHYEIRQINGYLGR